MRISPKDGYPWWLRPFFGSRRENTNKCCYRHCFGLVGGRRIDVVRADSDTARGRCKLAKGVCLDRAGLAAGFSDGYRRARAPVECGRGTPPFFDRCAQPRRIQCQPSSRRSLGRFSKPNPCTRACRFCCPADRGLLLGGHPFIQSGTGAHRRRLHTRLQPERFHLQVGQRRSAISAGRAASAPSSSL
jgi:hypothetical protein